MTTIHARAGDTAEIVRRDAIIRTRSFDQADNTVDVVWSTGAPVRRFGFSGISEVIETLDLNAARLERLNAGAPVLNSHDQFDLDAMIGTVVPGSARVVRGQGIARLRLADTPDVADIVAKVRSGIIRNISVGYMVDTYELRRARNEDEPDELRAIEWEPVELSFVTVPADPGAQVRNGETDMTRIVEGARRATRATPANRPAVQNRAGAAPEPHIRGGEDDDDDADILAIEQRAAASRRGRGVTVERIRNVCGRSDDYSRAFERQLLEDHAQEPLTEREFQERCADELIVARARPTSDTRTERDGVAGDFGAHGERGSPGSLHARMAGALYARMSGRAPDDAAREFMGASLIDMARGMMEARGERVRWTSPSQIVQRMGQHTTSDFPNVLGAAAQRYLLDVVRDYPSPLRVIARQRLANDFRKMMVARMGANPALLLVKENGEIKRGTVAEAKESYGLSTYARIFGISRQALINDDLGAFTDVFNSWGRAGAELEASLLAALVTGNGTTMDDGKTLYHADHGNLAGSGTAISVISLSAARQAVRSQKDIDGFTPLNIAPKYLVVGAAKETEAEQVLAELAAATVADVNPFAGKLELIVDSRIPGNGWRLFADPASWPVIEEARLAGQEDVFVDSRAGWDIDGIETKARLDIGATAIDWRGTYYNPGN